MLESLSGVLVGCFWFEDDGKEQERPQPWQATLRYIWIFCQTEPAYVLSHCLFVRWDKLGLCHRNVDLQAKTRRIQAIHLLRKHKFLCSAHQESFSKLSPHDDRGTIPEVDAWYQGWARQSHIFSIHKVLHLTDCPDIWRRRACQRFNLKSCPFDPAQHSHHTHLTKSHDLSSWTDHNRHTTQSPEPSTQDQPHGADYQ